MEFFTFFNFCQKFHSKVSENGHKDNKSQILARVPGFHIIEDADRIYGQSVHLVAQIIEMFCV